MEKVGQKQKVEKEQKVALLYAYKLTIAYDGTDYCGFQVQPNGPTIQGELMKAAIDLFGMEVSVTGASRTDSGVHARGQVAVLKSMKQIDVQKVPMALNVRLPKDIVIVGAEAVSVAWHPRYCDHHKTYEYKIYNGLYQFPQDYKDSYHCRMPLDIDLMQRGADLLVGTHDFESYSSSGKSVVDTVRTIHGIELLYNDSMIRLRVKGDGFLYNMVRIIAGTLMELGSGKRDLASIEASLVNRNRKLTGITAAAKGLTLLRIDYNEQQ